MSLVVLLVTTACASLPGEREVKQFLGLEQSFAHNDVPAPPTPATYVLQLGMAQAGRIVVHRSGGLKHEVTDPRAIQAVLNVFRAGATAQAPADATPPQTSLQLDFMIGSPARIITAHYNPTNNVLQMYNLPTAAWPDHAVAAYTMTPAFSSALIRSLQLPRGSELER